jgi:hypothetical protein
MTQPASESEELINRYEELGEEKEKLIEKNKSLKKELRKYQIIDTILGYSASFFGAYVCDLYLSKSDFVTGVIAAVGTVAGFSLGTYALNSFIESESNLKPVPSGFTKYPALFRAYRK